MTILTTSGITPTPRPAASSGTQRLRTSDPAPSATVPEVASAHAELTVAELEQVQRAVDRLKQSIKPALANTLEFQIDQGTGKAVVMIKDRDTDTVVRQIPSEEILSIAHALDRMQGRGGLVKEQA